MAVIPPVTDQAVAVSLSSPWAVVAVAAVSGDSAAVVGRSADLAADHSVVAGLAETGNNHRIN